jgi:hypothetical protein
MVTTTDPTERIRMMSDAARQAGKSFDSMDYFERKMIASAMGLKDVNELALVMRGRFDLVAGSVEQSAADIEKLAQQTKDYNTIMEEFSQLMRAFAVNVAGPVIRGLKMLADGMTTAAQNPVSFMVAGLGLITAAMATLAIVSGGTLAPFIAIGGVIAGVLVLFKGLYDMIQKSTPALDLFGKIWENISPRIEELTKRFYELFEGSGSLQESFDNFIRDYGPALEIYFTSLANMLLDIVEIAITFGEILNKNGAVFNVLGFAVGVLVAQFMAWVYVITAAVNASTQLLGWVMKLFHSVYVGNSPSLIDVFDMLASSITSVGTAFSLISGAISYALGGTPDTQVNNGGFNRKEDMESMAVSIGDEVARAVKEALQESQMNNKVQLEVKSDGGLASLFDFVQRGMDDSASGRAANHALNASRAGIG